MAAIGSVSNGMVTVSNAKVTDLPLAPRGLVPVPGGGQFASRTATSITVLFPKAATAPTAVLPVSSTTTCALLSFDPDTNHAVWVTVEGRSRLMLHRTMNGSHEPLVAVPNDTVALYSVGTYLVALSGDGDARVFSVPPGLLCASSEDCSAEALALGMARAEPESIGIALSQADPDHGIALALFSQVADELRFEVFTVSRGAPVESQWRGSLQLPDDDPPVKWAVSNDGAALCVIPKQGHAPLVAYSTGGQCIPIGDRLPPQQLRVRDVIDLPGGAFAFLARPLAPTERNDEVALLVLNRGQIVEQRLISLGATVSRGAPMALAAQPIGDGARCCIGIVAGRGFYAVELPCSWRPQNTVTATCDERPRTDEKVHVRSLAATLRQQSLAAVARPTSGVNGPVRRDGTDEFRVALDDLLRGLSGEPDPLAEFLRSARDVSAVTLLRVLARIVQHHASDVVHQLKWAAAVFEAVTPDPSSSLHRLRGSVPSAWTHESIASEVNSVATALFRSAFHVSLHALATGRLSVFTTAANVMDAAVIHCHATIIAEDQRCFEDAHTLLSVTARWALAEPGTHLGQLFAHCGPPLMATKEAQVVPPLKYRIPLTDGVAVKHERYIA